MSESTWVTCTNCGTELHCGECGVPYIPPATDYEALRERICRRIHAVGPASLNASQVTQLKLAMDDIRAALGGDDG